MKAKTNAGSTAIKLRIGDKEYPCRVTMGAMIRFKRDTGIDVSMLDTGDIENLVRFIWHCVESACRADGVPFEWDFEDFADNLDPVTLNDFYSDMNSGSDEEKKRAVNRPV